MKITYWMEKRTGYIYKYYGESKPLNADTDWIRVTGWEFDNQFKN